MLDIELMKKNCYAFSKKHGKSIEVLKCANGKSSYIDIAKKVHIHPTIVSSLLANAEKSGLAFKKDGFYKRSSGIMGFMPKEKGGSKISLPLDNVEQVQRKIGASIKKSNLAAMSYSSSLAPPLIPEMAEAYARLYSTENILRNFIRKVLGDTKKWWKQNCPAGVQTTVQNEVQRTPYNGAARNDELDYTHLGQLKDIIIYGPNWTLFKSHLHEQDKENFRVTIEKAIPTRNSIGHSITLKGIDFRECEVRFNDILRMIK